MRGIWRSIEGVDTTAALPATLAARAGSPLDFADLGRSLAMNEMTVKRYLALFETLFLAGQPAPVVR